MLNKPVNILLSSLIGLASLLPLAATAIEITVTPPRFEVDIEKKQSRSNSIKITNLSNKPTEMRAYVRNWLINDKNEFKDAPSNERSLDQWIVFTPSRFTIPPRSTQTVRFAIRPKMKPTSGEYRAVIYLEEVASNNPEAKSINAIGRVGVVIYGYAGDIKRVGSIDSITVDTKPNASRAVFDISNKGNAHVRITGQYAIWRAANYPGSKATQLIPNVGDSKTKLPANVIDAGKIELSPVLPNNRRQLALPLGKLPAGNYVLDINGDLSGMAVDKGIPFTVPNTNALPPNPKHTNS